MYVDGGKKLDESKKNNNSHYSMWRHASYMQNKARGEKERHTLKRKQKKNNIKENSPLHIGDNTAGNNNFLSPMNRSHSHNLFSYVSKTSTLFFTLLLLQAITKATP